MANEHEISRRVKRHFLQLAAVAFALGAEGALADAANADIFDEHERAAQVQRDEGGAAAPLRAAFQHVFWLGTPVPLPNPGTRAHVRVLDAQGRTALQLPLHGAGMVGPLPAGAYTVLVKTDGMTRVQQLRIGAGVGPWLHFSEPA